MKHTHTFTVGMRVAYAREWLRNTGQVYGDVPFARGTVKTVSQCRGLPYPVVHVQWDGHKELPVLGCNLWPVERLHLEPA